jgi:hypothetical protein
MVGFNTVYINSSVFGELGDGDFIGFDDNLDNQIYTQAMINKEKKAKTT